MRETEGDNPIDVSHDFIDLSDSEFEEKLRQLAGSKLILKLPISLFGANIFQMRLKRFLDGGGDRHVVIQALQNEKNIFEKSFPKGIDWEITDR